jgi:hypothetical protein
VYPFYLIASTHYRSKTAERLPGRCEGSKKVADFLVDLGWAGDGVGDFLA